MTVNFYIMTNCDEPKMNVIIKYLLCMNYIQYKLKIDAHTTSGSKECF